jgi:hypothetical protein
VDVSGLKIQQAINAGALSLALAIPTDTMSTGITFKLNSPNEPVLSLAIRQSVPGPSTLPLLGMSLTSLILWRRYFVSASSMK